MTERQKEEAHLKWCVGIIRNNIADYEEQVRIMSAEIKEMYEQYRDNDPEIFTQLSNTITMNENVKLALAKNERALKKPYFGRVDIVNEDVGDETLYIGKGGVMKDSLTVAVVDWRAPIANVYYENGLGECSYMAPGNVSITVELKKKRTYEVDEDRLIDFYDSEVVANDELLTKYLAKNKEAVLGEIIATIQKEQNDIIRKTPYHNVIVQGVAGSGKTTVAMHRISYILYNYGKDFRPEDFYIIGSNKMLLNYITGVLPDLDVHGIRQMTMEQLFIRLLYEDYDKDRMKVTAVSGHGYIKGRKSWFEALVDFCDRYEDENIAGENVVLDPERIEGEKLFFEKQVIYTKEQITSYRRESRGISMQSKINGLNERVMARLNNAITGRDVTYPAPARRRITKAYKYFFGKDKWKGSIYELYESFLTEQSQGWCEALEWLSNVREQKYDLYDLAALAYLYKRIKETDPIREASHIVVDEAQDFGMMAYECLDYCIPKCSWTIMGDVSQNIHFGFGLNDWEELKALMVKGRYDSFGVLSKSYRNTVEISQFAQKILRHGNYQAYPIEPIIRHGKPVTVKRCSQNQTALIDEAVHILMDWQNAAHGTIAVVCRFEQQAEKLGRELGKYIDIEPWNEENMEFTKGIMVLPVSYTKGLEFDAVLIYNPAPADYPVDDGHAKLLYVAATRALHELAVLYDTALTELIEV